MNRKIAWFAKGGGIAKMGPFRTQVEASNALRLEPVKDSNKIFPDDAFVWCEEINTRRSANGY